MTKRIELVEPYVCQAFNEKFHKALVDARKSAIVKVTYAGNDTGEHFNILFNALSAAGWDDNYFVEQGNGFVIARKPGHIMKENKPKPKPTHRNMKRMVLGKNREGI